jgi:hypothetical protein
MTSETDVKNYGQILASADTIHDFASNRCTNLPNLDKYSKVLSNGGITGTFSEQAVFTFYKEKLKTELRYQLESYGTLPQTKVYIKEKTSKDKDKDKDWKKELRELIGNGINNVHLCVDCQKHNIYDTNLIQNKKYVLLNTIAGALDTASKDKKNGVICHVTTEIHCKLYEENGQEDGEDFETIITYNGNEQILEFKLPQVKCLQPTKPPNKKQKCEPKQVECLRFNQYGVAEPNHKDKFTVSNLCSSTRWKEAFKNHTEKKIEDSTNDITPTVVKRSLDYTQVAFVKKLDDLRSQPNAILINSQRANPAINCVFLVTFDKLCFLKALYENVPVLYEKPGLHFSTFYFYNPSASQNLDPQTIIDMLNSELAKIQDVKLDSFKNAFKILDLSNLFKKIENKIYEKKQSPPRPVTRYITPLAPLSQETRDLLLNVGKVAMGCTLLVKAYNEPLHKLIYSEDLVRERGFNQLDKALIGQSNTNVAKQRLRIHDIIPNNYLIEFAKEFDADVEEDDFQSTYYTVSMLVTFIRRTKNIRVSSRDKPPVNYKTDVSDKALSKQEYLSGELYKFQKLQTMLETVFSAHPSKTISKEQLYTKLNDQFVQLLGKRGNKIIVSNIMKYIDKSIQTLESRIDALTNSRTPPYSNFSSFLSQVFRQKSCDAAIDFLLFLREKYIDEYFRNLYEGLKLIGHFGENSQYEIDFMKKLLQPHSPHVILPDPFVTPPPAAIPESNNSESKKTTFYEKILQGVKHIGTTIGAYFTFSHMFSLRQPSSGRTGGTGGTDNTDDVPAAPAKTEYDIEDVMILDDICLAYDPDDYEDLTELAEEYLYDVYKWANESYDGVGTVGNDDYEGDFIIINDLPKYTNLIEDMTTTITALMKSKSNLENLLTITPEPDDVVSTPAQQIGTKRPYEGEQPEQKIPKKRGGKRPHTIAKQTLQHIVSAYKPKRRRMYYKVVVVHSKKTRQLMAVRNIRKLLTRLK